METLQLTSDISVSGQVRVEDIPDLKAKGIKTLLINRPDGESYDQPDHQTIIDAAKAAGIEAHYIPFVPGQLDPAMISQFANVLRTGAGPMHAFCKMGGRSVIMWAFAQPPAISADEIIAKAAAVGVDLTPFAGHLAAR